MKEGALPYSLEVESFCLASFLQHPHRIPEFLPFVQSQSFYSRVHYIVFGGIRTLFNKEKTCEPVLLALHLENLGFKEVEGIPLADYIEGLATMHRVNPDSMEKYFRELNKFYVARKLCRGAENMGKEVRESLNEPLSALLGKAQKLAAECATADVEDDFSPVMLHEEVEDYVEGIAEAQSADGAPIPFRRWSDIYGDLFLGELLLIAAPAKGGKSTLLNNLAQYAMRNETTRCRVLYLDTEMSSEHVMRRLVSGKSGVSEWYIRNGLWRHFPEMRDDVRGALASLKKAPIFEHLYVANRPIEEVSAIIRRWRATRVEEGEVPVVFYDYLKLTGEKISDSWREHQVIGGKCDELKHLAMELNAAFVAAIQMNRSGDIAMANQVRWFASNIAMLRPKSPEEVSEHGRRYGTHTLTFTECRNMGKEGAGFEDWVSVPQRDGSSTYQKNFINLKFDNFVVKECGTLSDIVNRDAGQIEIESHEVGEDELL